MNFIQFGNRKIEYVLHSSERRKSLSISVNENGVCVTAPVGTGQHKIEEVLLSKAPWIIRQMAEFEEMQTAVQAKKFVSGEKLPYLGRYYRLKVEKTDCDKPRFWFYQSRFYAELPMETSEETHRDFLYPLYGKWIKEHAGSFVQDRIQRFTIKLQKEPQKIVIKDQEQRWGSCTASGDVLLNWRIFLAPTSIVDYVLAHELAHLKHMNHSKEYWETLRMLLPDYEQRKEWLKINGRTLNV